MLTAFHGTTQTPNTVEIYTIVNREAVRYKIVYGYRLTGALCSAASNIH